MLADMAGTEPQSVDKTTKEAEHHEEDAKAFAEPVTADWRVEAAVKTRWHSIIANPKIILIALFAS